MTYNSYHKTYLRLIEMEGQETADKYWANMIEIGHHHKGVDVFEKEIETGKDKLHRMIKTSFEWSKTTEGGSFWRNLYNKYEDEEININHE